MEPPPKRKESAPRPIASVNKPVRRAVDYACIARDLCSPATILQAMRASHPQAAQAESMTETEAHLARIWAELLERPSVSCCGTTSSTWAVTRSWPCCFCFAFGRASAWSFRSTTCIPEH